MKIAIEIGDKSGEGAGYENLGNSYHALGDYQKSIHYHEKDLKIAIEIGDRAGEGSAYGNLGIAYRSLGDYRKSIEYHERHLQKKSVIRVEKEKPVEISVMLTSHWVIIEKAVSIIKKLLKIAVGDRTGGGIAYRDHGT